MKIIALPVKDGKLGQHFGHCDVFHFYTLIECSDGLKVQDVEEKVPPAHEPGIIPQWVAQEGATDIIVGGIGQKAIDIFNQKGVNVLVGAATINVDKLISDYIDGVLEVNVNLCDH